MFHWKLKWKQNQIQIIFQVNHQIFHMEHAKKMIT